ncbi:MAG: 2-C-methyl-D-erythritol 4-phosphate cytidylyltransferase [Lachnospiraceae bacterium]|nr:2-C-methyl-D-erythritol 4-phosphate cytidylyltransferase [Lachnospiraceae bacterium]
MNIAVILSGGTGSRMGAKIPKQYIEVQGRPVIEHCLDQFSACEAVDAVQIVADSAWHRYIRDRMEEGLTKKWKGFSVPGANRQLSIFHALEDLFLYASADDYVMIHDAARPLVRPEFIVHCFACARGHEGVLPVLPMKDTVYLSEDGNTVSSLLKREQIFAGQAPEVFLLGKYYEANRRLLPREILKINGSTEPAIMAGLDVILISGDEGNFKITTQADLERFQRILLKQEGALKESVETVMNRKENYAIWKTGEEI